MTSECLVAAQLWIDELEKRRAVAVALVAVEGLRARAFAS